MDMILAARNATPAGTKSRFNGVQLLRSGGDVFVPVAMYNTLKDQHQQAVQERDDLALEVDAANDRVAEVMDDRDQLLAVIEALLAAKDAKDAALNDAVNSNNSNAGVSDLGGAIANVIATEEKARAVLATMKSRA